MGVYLARKKEKREKRRGKEEKIKNDFGGFK